jgi:hypothetical protein
MGKHLLRLYLLTMQLYPKEFRDMYGASMLQTLTDMLDDQPTLTGKLLICIRTGFDLQCSVVKEQLQSKGEKIMRTTNKFLMAGIWLAVAVIGSFLLPVLRHVGTTWTDWPGFIRVLGLLAFLLGGIILPAILSVLSLFGLPH